MQQNAKIIKIILAIIMAIALLRLMSLGMYPLFDPTEGRYAEMGRKMLELGNWVTPFIDYNVPFWAKPPLSFWLTAISYKIFGVSEFTARLPSFFVMCGIVWLVWGLAKDKADTVNESSIKGSDGLIAALILSSMGLFFYLAGGVMTDPSLALGVIMIMVAFWRSVEFKQKLWGYIFFVGVAVAMLAKGPIGIVLAGMPISLWVLNGNKWKEMWQSLPWISGTLLAMVVVLPWYIMAEMRTPGFLHYYIVGEHFQRFLVKGWTGDLYGSGRAHTIGTIWLYAILGMFPWSLLFIASLFSGSMRKALSSSIIPDNNWHSYLWLWALMPLVFFTLSRNILATYVITSLPAFAMLLAPLVATMLQNRKGRAVTFMLTAIIPVIFVSALIFVKIMPDSKFIPSQESVVSTYKELTQDKDVPLIYLGKRLYSADFYSSGRAVKVINIEDLQPYLNNEAFIVVGASFYLKLPEELKNRLVIVSEKNNSVLLHNKP